MDIDRPSSALLVPTQSTLASLRSLYSKAARSFLQRDVILTQGLIDGAFEILTPPASSQKDILSSQRRKWDMLRITLETTLYTTPGAANSTIPPSPGGSPSTPSTLKISADARSNLLLSPPSLLATLHTRSLRLFTPPYLQPSPAYLPAQILLALVFAGLKLECPQVARGMIEEWLARRAISEPSNVEQTKMDPTSAEGYAKVIDVYCLHVLPRLHEWDYATEFLRYESELPPSHRTHLQESLKVLHIQSQIPPSPPPPYSTPLPDVGGEKQEQKAGGVIPRPLSRASSSSSASTRTAVPATPRPSSQSTAQIPDSKVKDRRKTPNGSTKPSGLRRLERKPKSSGSSTPLSNQLHRSSSSSTSRSSSPTSVSDSRASTVKASRATRKSTNLFHAAIASASSASSTASSSSSPAQTVVVPASITHGPVSDMIALITQHFTTFKITVFPHLAGKLPLLVCVLLPILALITRIKSVRSHGVGRRGNATSLDEARKRLERMSVWRSAWRAIEDAVIMAGRGLV